MKRLLLQGIYIIFMVVFLFHIFILWCSHSGCPAGQDAFAAESKGRKNKEVQPEKGQKPELVVQNGHWGPATSVAYSPDGQRLITGNQDGTIRWWDGSSGECSRIVDTHSNVSSITLSPRGNFLVSGSHDGTVKFWDPRTGEFLASLMVFKDNNWLALSPGGLIDGTPGGMDHLRWVAGLKAYKLDALKVPGTSIYPGLLKGIFARAHPADGPSRVSCPDNRKKWQDPLK